MVNYNNGYKLNYELSKNEWMLLRNLRRVPANRKRIEQVDKLNSKWKFVNMIQPWDDMCIYLNLFTLTDKKVRLIFNAIDGIRHFRKKC